MKKNLKSQLGLPTVIWLGFSFIAGITFTASFSSVIASNGLESNGGVGIHIIWILALEGAIAFMCVWSFAKMVKHHPEANGGASQYSRTAFGRYMGLNSGFLSYSVIPIIVMNLMVSMIRTNFGEGSTYELTGPNGSWGSFANLYLDLISFVLFLGAAGIIFLGVKKFKIVANIIGYLTWALTLCLIIFAIIALTKNFSNGINGFEIYSDKNNYTLDFASFSKTFTTCFFAFSGIETFISTGNNIKDRNKVMPIAITLIMILTTLFYIIFTIVIMLAVTNGFGSNPNIQIFDSVGGEFIKKFGGTMIIICTILMRFNSSLQVSLFAGSALQPLSESRYITPKMRKNNKDNLPIAALAYSLMIFFICYILFMFIPDLVEGITNEPSPFGYTELSGVASILLILIYSINIVAVLKQGFVKKIKVHIVEYIFWTLALLFLVFEVFYYFYTLFLSLIEYVNDTSKINILIGFIVQVLYITLVQVTSVLVYFFYYKKEIKKIKEENGEEYKKLLDYEKVFNVVN